MPLGVSISNRLHSISSGGVTGVLQKNSSQESISVSVTQSTTIQVGAQVS